MTKPLPFDPNAYYSARVECEILDVVQNCQPCKRGQIALRLPHYSHNTIDRGLKRQRGICLQRDSQGYYSLVGSLDQPQKGARGKACTLPKSPNYSR